MVRIKNSETQFVSSDNTKRQATPIHKKTLTGERAFTTWLNLAFETGEKIWLKFAHNEFLTGIVNKSGNFHIWETRGAGTNRRRASYHTDAYEFLSQRTTELDGGTFYIPGKPTDYPLKEFCSASDDIGGEMDDGNAEEQWSRIELIAHYSGLLPAYIIGSGGKSAHPHWKLVTAVPIAKRTFFAQMLAIALLGDPAVTNPHQPMRVPGFFRREKGKEQTLEYYSEARCTPEEFEQGMQRCFIALNFTWHDSLSQDRWQEVRRILAGKLPRSEKENSIRHLLALPESELPENVRRRELQKKRERRTVTGFIGTANSLVDAVNQASEKLGSDAFDWAGHNWQWTRNKARGSCPWHESTTGTAGWIAPRQNGNEWGFACPTCTDNKQLNAFAYRWHLKNGLSASYPKGKDWVAAVKDFCQVAGVPVPESPEREYIAGYQAEEKEDSAAIRVCVRDSVSPWDSASPMPSARHSPEGLASAQRARARSKEQEQFEEHVQRHSEELAAGAKIQLMLNYPERVKRTHSALRSIEAFKPIIQDTQFINLLVDQFFQKEQAEEKTAKRSLTDLEPGFYGLKGNMGGGKTVQVRDVVNTFPSGNMLTFRNSIVSQFCHNDAVANKIQFIWDIKGIQSTEEQGKAWLKAKEQWMGGCIESLAEFKPKDILVLEEVERVKHSILVGSTCRRDRRARLKLLKEYLQDAKYVFLCDADLSGSTLKWLQALDPSKKINVVHNITKRFEWQCYFYTGISQALPDGEVKLSPNNRAEFELALLNCVAHGRIPLIATDSQRWAEVIERTILMVNPNAKGIRIDSTTKASDDPKIRAQVDAFLSDPNKWIEENQPDYVIYSPICEASLDITIQDYFDAVYGCFVHANFLSCKQLLGRLRTNAPRHIFAKTHVGSDDVGSNSPLPQVLAKHMFQHNFETLREIILAEYPEVKDDFQLVQKLAEIIDFESGEYKNPHIQAIIEIKAQDNYSRSDLRKLLAEELQQCGHIVTMLEPCTQEISLPSSPHRKEIIQEWAEEIANSEDISIERAREIQNSVRSKMSERHAATKAILQYRLPDYTITSKFLEDHYLDDRNWITRQEIRFLLDHPEMSRQFDQETWSQALKNDTAWWDIRTNALKIKALSTLGIPAIAKSGKAWDKDTDWVLDFKELVLQNQKLVKLALNITAKEDSDPCYLLRRCLLQAGYPVIGSQRRKDGTRIRIYKVDAKVLADDGSVYADVGRAISRRQDSERIAKRFESKLSKLHSDVTASQTNPVEIIISSVCDTSDLLIPAGLEEIKENLDEQDPPPNYPSPPNELQLGDAVTINLPKSKHHGRLAYISEIYRSCGQDWVSASFDDGTSSKVDLPTHEVGEAFVKQATA